METYGSKHGLKFVKPMGFKRLLLRSSELPSSESQPVELQFLNAKSTTKDGQV